MKKAAFIMILALVGAPLIAGCVGSDDAPTVDPDECTDESICGENATTADGKGSVIGKVSNQLFEAVQGANVTLRQDSASGNTEVTTKTDESGKYVFQNLEPATYTLMAVKPGYFAATKEVVVEAGKEATGDIKINAQPKPPEPFSQHWEFSGMIECTGAFRDVAPDNPCRNKPESLQHPDAKTTFTWVMSPGISGIAIYVDSEPSAVTGTKIPLQLKWSKPVFLGTYPASGATPFSEIYDFAALGITNETIDGEIKPESDGEDSIFNVRVARCDDSPCYGSEIYFTVWLEAFYHGMEIPPDFIAKPEA